METFRSPLSILHEPKPVPVSQDGPTDFKWLSRSSCSPKTRLSYSIPEENSITHQAVSPDGMSPSTGCKPIGRHSLYSLYPTSQQPFSIKRPTLQLANYITANTYVKGLYNSEPGKKSISILFKDIHKLLKVLSLSNNDLLVPSNSKKVSALIRRPSHNRYPLPLQFRFYRSGTRRLSSRLFATLLFLL